MDYRSFGLSDFVFDEDFRRWVLDPDAEARHFWEDFLTAHPAQRPVVAEARLLVLYGAVVPGVPAEQTDRSWYRLRLSLEAAELAEHTPTFHPAFRKRGWAVAASVAVLLLAGLGAWLYLSRYADQTYQTAFGETRTFSLRDGSRVTLNGNSRLRFAAGESRQKPREVWLEGEAFFSVTHQPDHQKFVVHTPRLDVQVLGTEFNVYTRRAVVKVLLESGRVKLSATGASRADSVLMRPGQLFVTQTQGFGTLKTARPERYTAWKENRLLLDQTSLAELVQILHETYGFEVRVRDKTLLRLTASGSMPLTNADEFLTQISRLFALKIEKSNATLMIEKR